ncbi:family 43 glycosylhydrolase [Marinicrinis lubricantis]|uniref:Family 43 glycosylhydrolase n=1 Tax=Marinicrinis lubricantis TaxID=2086470 RepID=A0ABW1IJH8_9BACL
MENNRMRSGDLGDGTFLNPIIRGNYADPSIIRVNEDYYMVHTSYEYIPGLIIWHSNDLVNWEPIGSALHKYTGDVWAPDFVHYGGKYYIYFPSQRTNWVITADDPRGPWSEPVNLHTKYIDPGHVVGPDGKRYLHLSGGYMIELEEDGITTVGEARKIYEPWKYPEDWIVEAFSLEGPKLTYRDGYYYLTVAQGGTAGPPTSHMVAVSRSRTPWGPWEHSPHNPIIRTESAQENWWSQGHGSLVDTPEGDWWMVFHAYEKGLHSLGRQTLLLPVEWTPDGWFRIPEGVRADQTIPKPGGYKVAHGWPESDNFRGGELGTHWQLVKGRGRERHSVQDGWLQIEGREENDGNSPLLYMSGHPSYEVEIEVCVQGDAEGRLILYYDDSAYFGIGVSKQGIRHFRTFKSYRAIPFQSETVRLCIRNDWNIVSMHYDTGEGWKKYDKVIDASGFHHNTFGRFLSLRVGLDAVGQGTARFTDFRYTVR